MNQSRQIRLFRAFRYGLRYGLFSYSSITVHSVWRVPPVDFTLCCSVSSRRYRLVRPIPSSWAREVLDMDLLADTISMSFCSRDLSGFVPAPLVTCWLSAGYLSLFSLSFSLFAKPTLLKSTLLYATKSCPHSALRPIFSENCRLLYCLNLPALAPSVLGLFYVPEKQ